MWWALDEHQTRHSPKKWLAYRLKISYDHPPDIPSFLAKIPKRAFAERME